ncbi:transcriptional regulator CaiF [Salmonella enterica subsp. enterica serovar Infantis]|nr:transcriptional regulator CaiF [Salmonella enterica subsp. enterica serovar Infantis]
MEDEYTFSSRPGDEPCFIPQSVRQYAGEPLYILVAWWCLQQHGWVHRTQIAGAFHIPSRRASYLMAYLRNKSRRVLCETREVMLVNNVRRYEILITRVTPPPSRRETSKAGSPRRTRWRVGNADSSQATRLWNQLRAGSDGQNTPEDDDEPTA